MYNFVSQISVGVNTNRPSPALHVTQQSIQFNNVNRFQVCFEHI